MMSETTIITVGALLYVAVLVAISVHASRNIRDSADFVQALIIIVGLVLLFPLVLADLGGWSAMVQAAPAGHFNLVPEPTLLGALPYIC